ncbi:hypothetical protein [Natrinema sp. H-ect4]|uniref:hypothetical protein n=1 Tax=Natrinema sp. H-ect4 TaxID=3242699 RepID=UPI0035A92C28
MAMKRRLYVRAPLGAATGNPNSHLRPDWPQFTAGEQTQVRLTEDEIVRESGPKPECQLWDPVYRDNVGL